MVEYPRKVWPPTEMHKNEPHEQTFTLRTVQTGKQRKQKASKFCRKDESNKKHRKGRRKNILWGKPPKWSGEAKKKVKRSGLSK